MDSEAKDKLKIKVSTEDKIITNYDQMLKELIEFVHECCGDALEHIENDNIIYAAYSIGRLHLTVSNSIEQFGIGHLFKENMEQKDD